ncbi:MAG: class I SAM-dependent methyltransferase [Dehalococcoidia bacterium]
MPDRFSEYLINLYGEDPFAEVRIASDLHRVAHAKLLAGGEQECGVYPSDMLKMRVVVTIARAVTARRILEIGGGLGYSALWLATSGGSVETIDRFPEHVASIRSHAGRYGLSDRLQAFEGEGEDILASLDGTYDLVHDDGWFAAQPRYYERLADIVRPGGLLVMSNWFLLEHAVTGESPIDWSLFAGPSWRDDIRAYAERLTTDERWDLSFVQRPAVALAWRRPDA